MEFNIGKTFCGNNIGYHIMSNALDFIEKGLLHNKLLEMHTKQHFIAVANYTANM